MAEEESGTIVEATATNGGSYREDEESGLTDMQTAELDKLQLTVDSARRHLDNLSAATESTPLEKQCYQKLVELNLFSDKPRRRVQRNALKALGQAISTYRSGDDLRPVAPFLTALHHLLLSLRHWQP